MVRLAAWESKPVVAGDSQRRHSCFRLRSRVRSGSFDQGDGMLYSKTAKYAVLALAEIASREDDGLISTRRIAEATSTPYPLLAKIVNQLHRRGFVAASRGKRGGIKLARPASEITIKDVVVALDGPGMLNDCPLYLEPCNCDKLCSLHEIWKPTRDAVVAFLDSTSIQHVADARRGS
jgi:Rrf2 family protein